MEKLGLYSTKKQKMKFRESPDKSKTSAYHCMREKFVAQSNPLDCKEEFVADGGEIQNNEETEPITEDVNKTGISSNSFHNIPECKGKYSTSSNSNSTVMKVKESQKDTSKLFMCHAGKLNSYTVLHRVLYNNFFFSVGDIVSLEDNDDTYYAQIRILIEDLFCQKYAALIWLLPTNLISDDREEFNPYLYTCGPQDDCFYKVQELKFVMHAPTEAYKQFIPPTPKCSNITHLKFKARPKRKT